MQKKHLQARRANEASEIREGPGPIDVSNVKVVCPSCGKATRVHHNVVDGKKVRVCACGAVLDKAYSKKANAKVAVAEEAPKKRTRKRAAKAETTENN